MFDMRSLGILSKTETRSVSPENPSGEKGCGAMLEWEKGSAKDAARDLGTGWKVNPYLVVNPGEEIVLADVKGSGVIKHVWMTLNKDWRLQILRFYWDGNDIPAVECPASDFFACGWEEFSQINSLAVCVNPGSGFNCYWNMPFRKSFRITMENLNPHKVNIYYQISYELKNNDEDIAYFHAQFRRVNPLPYKEVFTILDHVEGNGHYVGTFVAWGVNNNGWWGEGEIKFYMDGDKEYPTICGTGTEDYFGGSYNFENPSTHDEYLSFSSPYSGLQVVKPNRLYKSKSRFGMYRWHLNDPLHFQKDLKVTIQALGMRNDGQYLPLQDDISAVAFFYLDAPCTRLPQFPGKSRLEIN